MHCAPFTPADTAAMTQALTAAAAGPRSGNPLVGAVIVTATGENYSGYHHGAGTPHAEVEAIAAAQRAGADLRAATMYVTLEPCTHTGRTGPCTEAIIAAGIPRVIIAQTDPTPLAGGGAVALTTAGVQVTTGVLADQAATLNAPWLRSVGHPTRPRPLITAKWAQSLDGYCAATDGTSQWITSEPARAHAHSLRARVDAVAVGIGTVWADNPRLTVRHGVPSSAQPTPVVFGTRPLPEGSYLHANPATRQCAGRDLHADLAELYAAGIRHILLDGGPTLIASFFAADLIDELYVYIAPLLLGGGRRAFGGAPAATLSAGHRLHPDPTGDGAVLVRGPDTIIHTCATTLPTDLPSRS